VQVPHQSSRLAKIALRRTPAVAAVQNVLLRKLGLVGEDYLDVDTFNKCVTLFNQGLTEVQVELIK
jgi:hypothetical protein